MSPGDIAWASIGGAWLCWLVVTSALPQMPGVARFVRAVLSSWIGRSVALAAWAGAGWHLFCQHP